MGDGDSLPNLPQDTPDLQSNYLDEMLELPKKNPSNSQAPPRTLAYDELIGAVASITNQLA